MYIRTDIIDNHSFLFVPFCVDSGIKETFVSSCSLQVWFQNKRSKERRMKQMSGRGKFFLGGPKLRKFGLDDGRFYFYDGRPDFGYGPPPPPFGPGGMGPGDFYPPPPPNSLPPPGAFGGMSGETG